MAVASTKLTAVKLLKHLKPNKIESEMTFGFDTPDKTGQVTAMLAILYGIMRIDTDRFKVIPDFENKFWMDISMLKEELCWDMFCSMHFNYILKEKSNL